MLSSKILRRFGPKVGRYSRRIHDDRPVDFCGGPEHHEVFPFDIRNTKRFSIVYTLFVSSGFMTPIGILFYQMIKQG